jgi:hypothetical protein
MHKSSQHAPDVAVGWLQSSSEYHHVKGRKDKSGSKLVPLINVNREVTINFRSQSDEYTARQEDHSGYVFFFKINSIYKMAFHH